MKDIKQIQEENRKLILEATLTGNNLRVLKEGIGDFANAPITLSRVLPAFNLEDFCDKECLISLKDKCLVFDDFIWELSKENLEEQSHQTQISINKLLKGEQ